MGYFLSVMLWGAMLRERPASVAKDRSVRRWLHEEAPFLVVTAIVLCRPAFAILWGSRSNHPENWRGTFLGLMLFVAFTRLPSRHAKPFVWLGTISYSLYLLHPVVLYPLLRLVKAHEPLSHANVL